MKTVNEELEKFDSNNDILNVPIRDERLLMCRPTILTDEHVSTLAEEAFQNNTLRPILKFQNDILLHIFKHYASKYAKNFSALPVDKKIKFIEQSIQKDSKLRSLFKGLVIGHFTITEYATYESISHAINKRIYALILERFKSQMLFFEQP